MSDSPAPLLRIVDDLPLVSLACNSRCAASRLAWELSMVGGAGTLAGIFGELPPMFASWDKGCGGVDCGIYELPSIS